MAVSPTPAPSLAPELPDCTQEVGTLCRKLYDSTGSEFLARSSDALIVKPALIVLIFVIAFIVRALLRRAVSRFLIRTVEEAPQVSRRLRRVGGSGLLAESPMADERRRQRAETLGSVLRSITSIVVFTIAVIQALAVLGVNLAPIVASAGIVGVAVGFGAQNLVRDFLSGIFMLLEDQYGVGDVIDAGPATGAVEAVGLRVTRLRDVEGVVWYVRNGEILRIGNMSQGWSRALLDIDVAYDSDLDLATATIRQAAESVRNDPAFADAVLEAPDVWGVQHLGADGITIRLVVKTVPLEQWRVARELRRRIKDALTEVGVEIPFPQRTLWVRDERGGTPLPTAPRGADDGQG